MKKIGLLGMSDPVNKEKANMILSQLQSRGFEVELSDIVSVSSSGKERAEVFNQWMREDCFDYIMDISGGDLANLTLNWIDYEAYKESKSIFFGYSDVTVVLNSLYEKTKKECCLFQVRNEPYFDDSFDQFVHTWINPGDMSGTVIGGNLRCFLKLAGTPYMPDPMNKILFLESYSGDENRILTYFSQLEQMGVFKKVSGLILGQFTELDQKKQDRILYKIVTDYNIPVCRTHQIGHAKHSKALWIGRHYTMEMLNSSL